MHAASSSSSVCGESDRLRTMLRTARQWRIASSGWFFPAHAAARAFHCADSSDRLACSQWFAITAAISSRRSP